MLAPLLLLRRGLTVPSRKVIRGVLAFIVALMGCMNGLTVLLPLHPGRLPLFIVLFDQLAPFGANWWPVIRTSHTVAVILAFFLVLLAFGLARGKFQTWIFALILLPLSAIAHILKGFDFEEALLAMGVWILLLMYQPCFRVESDPWRARQGISLLLVGVALLLAYSLGGFYLIQEQFVTTTGPFGTFVALVRRIFGIHAHELMPLTRQARWFLSSIPWLSMTALLTGMIALLQPVRARWWIAYQQKQQERQEQAALGLVRRSGCQTLSFLALARENLRYLAPDGAGLVCYQLCNSVAVVPGDPICAPEARAQVTQGFVEMCARKGWQVAFYQAHAAHLPLYRSLGLTAFKIGEEALIDPQQFTLSGGAMANVRTSSKRAEREGVTLRWFEGAPPEETLAQLLRISNAWLESKGEKGGSEMGFSMGRLSALQELAARARLLKLAEPGADEHTCCPDLLTGIAYDRSGEICAFITFTPVYGLTDCGRPCPGWALDLMRRTPDAPYGVMELLLVRAIERFRESGARRLSLGLIAAADTREELSPAQRTVAQFLCKHIHMLEEHRSLFRFKQKFQPTWESRYVVASNTVALPKIALAILRAHQV